METEIAEHVTAARDRQAACDESQSQVMALRRLTAQCAHDKATLLDCAASVAAHAARQINALIQQKRSVRRILLGLAPRAAGI